MAKTPEKKVKDTVVKHLKDLGVYFFYPVTGGYGGSGVPDIVCCYSGKFYGIECKAGKGRPTALQIRNLQNIKDCGGIAVVIDESNMNHTKSIMAQVPVAIEEGENKWTRWIERSGL